VRFRSEESGDNDQVNPPSSRYIRRGWFVLSILFLPLLPPHEPGDPEDQRQPDRHAQACGAVEEGAVLRRAGEEVRRTGGGEEEGAEKREEDREGRAAADDPGGVQAIL